MNTIELASAAPSSASVSSLPLRRDEVLGADVLAKVIFLTVLLLVVTYFLLRVYARHIRTDRNEQKPLLQYEAGMRLSSRTKAYVLRVDNMRVLVTESPSGISTLSIGKVQTGEGNTTEVIAVNPGEGK